MNIQKQMTELFGNSCYAYCIAYLYGKKRTIYELTEAVLGGWKAGYISNGGYVSAPHLFANFCIGKKGFYTDVIQKPYKPTNYEQIVCWEYGHKTHFVVMKDGQIVFDPWPNSETVRLGNPVSVREYI